MYIPIYIHFSHFYLLYGDLKTKKGFLFNFYYIAKQYHKAHIATFTFPCTCTLEQYVVYVMFLNRQQVDNSLEGLHRMEQN
jgi:hypothetical protein